MSGDPRVLAPLQQAYLASDDVHTTRAIESAWQHETSSWNVVCPNVTERIRAWTPPPAEPSLDDLVFGLSIKFAEVTLELAELKKQHAELIDNITAGFTKVDRRIRAITNPDCICGTEDGASCPVHSHPEPTAPVIGTPAAAHLQVKGNYVRASGRWYDQAGRNRVTLPDEVKMIPTDMSVTFFGNTLTIYQMKPTAPQPAPDLDPVLLKIAELFVFLEPDGHRDLHPDSLAFVLRRDFRTRQNEHWMTDESDRRIRAYLKDGGA